VYQKNEMRGKKEEKEKTKYLQNMGRAQDP